MNLNAETSNIIAQIREKLPRDKVIVFISGIFNIIHPGHARLLHYASEQGDYVVVGVFANKVRKGAILPEEDRLHAIAAMNWVDNAFILHDSPEEFIAKLQPNIVVKGREYQDIYNSELKATEEYGGRLLFSSGESRFSSIELIRKEIQEVNFSTIDKNNDFIARHNFSHADLVTRLKKFSDLNVIVVGDTIVDEYVSCDAVGLSQEDPTIVVRPVVHEVFVGGAGIVSAHANGMGAKSNLFTVLGQDDKGVLAKNKLKNYNVNDYSVIDDTRPTTHKCRYRASGKTLLRVNEYSQQSIDITTQNRIYDSILSKLDDADVLIFSDFNYGLLPQELVDRIAKAASEQGVMMVGDCQCSSQIGDVSRFKGMSLITPTEYEARVATRDNDSGLIILADKLRQKTAAQHIVLTLGSEGALITTYNESKNGEWITDQIPALNTSPRDPAGAGDALMVVSALALATGASIWEAVYLGSLAAACQVGRIGNIPLSREELLLEIGF